MAIDTECSGCGRQLRVADEHAGKQARCPACKSVYVVPDRPATAASGMDGLDPHPTRQQDASHLHPVSDRWADGPSPDRVAPPGIADPVASAIPTSSIWDEADSAGSPAAAEALERWYLRIPEGEVFGPVGRSELDDWVREGRVSCDCELRVGDGGWLRADFAYPELSPERVSSTIRVAGRAAPQMPRPARAAPLTQPPYAGRQGSVRPLHMAPDRGGAVFALAVLSWPMFCPVLSVIALVMALMDLSEMKQGRVDPRGATLTKIGLWISVFHLGFLALLAVSNGLRF